MSQTYQTEGIILKSMAMQEADRLLTILSPERGLIKAIASGARKPKSKLGGRTSLFVVNHMMCLKGRSLDKLLQADVTDSFPGLSRNLQKLTTAQYWAEIVLFQSLAEQPNPDLYHLQLKLLKALEHSTGDEILSLLLKGISQLLHLAGVMPVLDHCCRSQTQIDPVMFTTGKGVYFSCEEGGTVIGDLLFENRKFENPSFGQAKTDYTVFGNPLYQSLAKESSSSAKRFRLTIPQWIILNQISPQLASINEETLLNDLGVKAWLSVEKILRGYAQFHFERTIQSASLVDSVFTPSFTPQQAP